MKFNLKYIVTHFILLTLALSIYGQTNRIIINGNDFQIKFNKSDALEGERLETINLYRGNKKLLTHTALKKDGDCSSISVELGSYKIDENSIVFYSYWAITDRIPSLLAPFGFKKQIYSIDKNGKLTLSNSEIYIEDYLEKGKRNEIFYEKNNEWKHCGLELLNRKPKNDFEQNALEDYIKNIEQKYNSKFVLGKEKKMLEMEVRKILKKEIAQYTGDWVKGEIYGNVKK